MQRQICDWCLTCVLMMFQYSFAVDFIIYRAINNGKSRLIALIMLLINL